MRNPSNPSRICPLCREGYSAPSALSRFDNKTEICPICGAVQAIKAMLDCKMEEAEKHGN